MEQIVETTKNRGFLNFLFDVNFELNYFQFTPNKLTKLYIPKHS